MSVYTVARKIPSMDSYTVVDQSGNQVFGAKHHHGMMQEHWDITDAQGNQVATLTHERKHIHATYRLNGPNLPDLTLTKVNFMPVAETWSITGGPAELTVSGDLANYDWNVQAEDRTIVATLQRKLVSLHRQYIVNADVNEVVPIAMAIALDAEEDEHKR